VGGVEGEAIRKSLGGCSKPRFSLRQPLAHFPLLEIGSVVHMVHGCTRIAWLVLFLWPNEDQGPGYEEAEKPS
jgi:hypothetical protein